MYSLRQLYPKGNAMNLNAKLLLNSLYGKFGMKSESTKVEIIENTDKIKLNKFIDKFNTNIVDIIYLEDYTVIIYLINEYKPTAGSIYNDTDAVHQMDNNVAIASAISAYARIHMSQFKKNPDFKLYYSDTDSIINKELPGSIVGSGLGKMKLEHVITKAVFLAPKVYGLIDTDGNEIIKAKGLTKDSIQSLKLSHLELLLNKDSSKLFTQSKEYKSLFKSNITVLETAYTLKATSNKRQLIYKNGIFDSTKPFKYDEIK